MSKNNYLRRLALVGALGLGIISSYGIYAIKKINEVNLYETKEFLAQRAQSEERLFNDIINSTRSMNRDLEELTGEIKKYNEFKLNR